MSIDDVLSEISQEQGIGITDPIDIDKVSDAELEKLGDSVMEAMIGNPVMHDQMDIKLGYNYLSGYPDSMMHLMSGEMMNNYQGGMMGSYQVGKLSNFNQGNNMTGSFGWGICFWIYVFHFPHFECLSTY